MYESHATDRMVGMSEKICPHCGVEANHLIPTQLDRARGVPYWPHSFGRVMRVGRERQQMLLENSYKTDILRRRLDKLDAFIPTGQLHR